MRNSPGARDTQALVLHLGGEWKTEVNSVHDNVDEMTVPTPSEEDWVRHVAANDYFDVELVDFSLHCLQGVNGQFTTQSTGEQVNLNLFYFVNIKHKVYAEVGYKMYAEDGYEDKALFDQEMVFCTHRKSYSNIPCSMTTAPEWLMELGQVMEPFNGYWRQTDGIVGDANDLNGIKQRIVTIINQVAL